EPGAPVVVGVEKPVLEHDPAALPYHPPVIAGVSALLHETLVGKLRRRRRIAGQAAPRQQHQRNQRLDRAGEVAYPRQPPACLEVVTRVTLGEPALFELEASQLAEVQRLDELEVVHRVEAVAAPPAELVQRERALRDQ